MICVAPPVFRQLGRKMIATRRRPDQVHCGGVPPITDSVRKPARRSSVFSDLDGAQIAATSVELCSHNSVDDHPSACFRPACLWRGDYTEHRDGDGPPAVFGNPIWQSNRRHWLDTDGRAGLKGQFRTTGTDEQDGLDNPDGPPERVAQMCVYVCGHCSEGLERVRSSLTCEISAHAGMRSACNPVRQRKTRTKIKRKRFAMMRTGNQAEGLARSISVRGTLRVKIPTRKKPATKEMRR